MKPTKTICLAIALALLAWLFFSAGVTKIFIDTFDPAAQAAVNAEMHRQTMYLRLAGAVCLFGATWVSVSGLGKALRSTSPPFQGEVETKTRAGMG